MCKVAPELCAEVGEVNMAKAISYSGSNSRLRRFLAKARNGEAFTVAVVGGSVSAGHGLSFEDGGQRLTPTNMHRVVFDHLTTLFPQNEWVVGEKSQDGKNGFVNGAQGGKGSNYFSMCFGEHIPEEADLILLELSINDDLQVANIKPYELLLRGLLDLPNQPAILSMHIFALMFSQIALGGEMQEGLTQYYDIPIVSLRNVILHDALHNVTLVQDLFHQKETPIGESLDAVDLRHLSAKGHRLMGALVNAYIDSQLCQMGPEAGPDDYAIEPLPRLRLMQKYDTDSQTPELHPDCFSTDGTVHTLEPKENGGWRPWNWQAKKYLIADIPGAWFTVPFHTSFGSVELYYLRSREFGLGSISCWVDDERWDSKRADGYWNVEYNIGQSVTVRNDLASGEHELHCELLEETKDPQGGHEFRVISVMSI